MAELLKIPFENIKKIKLFGGGKAQTLNTLVKEFDEKPDYVFNAGHFDNTSGSATYGITVSDTIIDGNPINTSISEDVNDSAWKYSGNIYTNMGIGFNSNGDMAFVSTADAYNQKYESFVGGSPDLLNNSGRSSKLKTSFGNQKVYRLAMGFDEKNLIVGFPKDKITLLKLTDFMQEKGAVNAIALDGGGSINVCQYVDGKYKHIDNHNYNRPVSTFVCIWLKNNDDDCTTQNIEDVPQYDNKKAIGVYEITWNSASRRVGNGLNYALAGEPLIKGNQVTVFEQRGNWLYSYGYWISASAAKLIKKY